MQLRRQLPLIVVFVTAVLVMLFKFVNFGETGKNVLSQMDKWSQVTSIVAFLLGPINLIRLHLGNVTKRRPRWVHSALTLVVIVVFTIVFALNGSNGEVTLWIINNIAIQISGAIYAMLGFYICSAAYRSFKLRNLEATVLLLSAVILMLAQAPIGEQIIPGISKWGEWILSVPNSAGMRGIRLGAAIGAFAASIRVILGLERSWVGGSTAE